MRKNLLHLLQIFLIQIFFVLGTNSVCNAAANPSANNFYERLGVSVNASDEEITLAWRKAMMQFHPDRGGTDEQSKRLNEAHDALINKKTTAGFNYQESKTQRNYYQESNADIEARTEFVRASLAQDYDSELLKKTQVNDLDKLNIALTVVEKYGHNFIVTGQPLRGRL